MEIPEDKSWLAKYRWSLLLVALVIMAGIVAVAGSRVFASDATEELGSMVARVERASFKKVVSSYGKLKAKQQRTLISRSAGTLVEIRKRPGESVTADTVVLVLSNPDVISSVRKATLELQKAKADFAALEAELMSEKLTMDNDIRMLEAEISTQEAELAAQEILAKDAIISELDMRKARMKLHQLELKLELAQEKKVSSAGALKARRDSGRLAVEQAQYLLKMEQEKQADLNVTAGIDGVLQSQQSSLALGQWVTQGSALGVVSGTGTLFAELNVNAAEAPSIQLGLPVALSIRGRAVKGKVIRIAPNASQNQVQVDVEITDRLPSIARADLDIRGEIIVADQANVNVLPRPSVYREGQPLQLYVKRQDGLFILQDIPVLEASEDQLLLGPELALGTDVILTDPEQWERRPQISVE